MSDKRDICRCGNAISELMLDTEQLQKNIGDFRFENIQNIDLQKVRTYIFNNYSLIYKVREFCQLDTREEEKLSDENFTETASLVYSKDHSAFSVHRGTINANINKIKYGIQQKIKDCSR